MFSQKYLTLKTFGLFICNLLKKLLEKTRTNSKEFWKIRKTARLIIRNSIRFEGKIIRFIRFEKFSIRLIRKYFFNSKNSIKINSKFVRFDLTPPLERCCRPLKFKNNFASFQCLVSAKLKSYFRYLLLWCSSPAKLKQQKTTTKLVTTAKPNFLLVPKSLDDDQSKMLLFAFRLIVYWVFMGLPLLDDQTFGYQSINKTSFDETLEELL